MPGIKGKQIMNSLIFIFAIFSAASKIFCCYLPVTRPSASCDGLDQYIIHRSKWGAMPPSGPMECLSAPAIYVIIHHTVTNACASHDSCCDSMRKLQKEHMADNKWPDIGYHFMIGGNGKAYEGRPWYKMGGHTKNHNRISIGIAFFGEYSKDCPAPEMLDLVPKIISCGVKKGYIHPNYMVIGHRDAYCSACPGKALHNEMKKWSRFPAVVPIPSYSCDAIKNPSSSTKAETSTTPKTTTETTSTTTPSTTTPTTSSPAAKSELPVYFYLVLSRKPVKC